MSTKPPALSAESNTFFAAPSSVPAPTSAPHAHGVWRLGVVIMRAIRFRSKALLICILFILPLAMLAHTYFGRAGEDIDFSDKEIVGVSYNRAVLPLLDLPQQLRRDSHAVSGDNAPAVASDKQALAKAYETLVTVERELGGRLQTAGAYEGARKAYERALNAPSGPESFALHTAHSRALMKLMQTVTDNSNLTLDPEIVTYYLMDAALMRAPDVVENTAQVRGKGIEALHSGAISSAQQRELIELISIAQFQLSAISDGLGKIAEDTSLTKRLDFDTQLSAASAFYKFANQNVVDKLSTNPADAVVYRETANKLVAGQFALADRLIAELDAKLKARVAGLRFERNVVIGVIAITLSAAAYFFYSFYLVTSGGLGLISKHLKEMAQGDLRKAPAAPWGKDEPAAVIKDLRTAYDSLHHLVATVRHSALNLNATSKEIAMASLDLSARSEAAAGSLEQQASAMEEIGSTVGTNADRAAAAAQFATENANIAEQGGKVIAMVVDTMQAIQTSSEKIGDIISVIDSIAFQTNILALNAAVEAARAGESGRGFAVVATEVRTLAHRSAAAAAEIKTLIMHSADQIRGGTIVVEQAGGTMVSVVDNAKKMSAFLGEISTASREQTRGVSQVAAGIHELDSHTQQNAALVEETSAACVSLKQQANALQLEIANFRVD